jgi:putative flippase GtrA
MAIVQLTLKYSFFAVLATLANLLAQEFSIRLYAGVYGITVAMIAGTVIGLICKYVLDKHYIFAFKASSAHEDMRKFLAYGLTGVLTTALFWSFELSFEYFFGTKFARYVGALIGLTIGYVIKYRLDKRFVFSKQES